MIRHLILASAAVAVFVGGVGQATAGVVYNNANDFSSTNNPNGVWSYGSLAAGATPDSSTFALYATGGVVPIGLGVWSQTAGSLPSDFFNPTGSVINPSGTNPIQPGQAGFHPGSNGEYSDYRFTTPTAGSYTLSALFTGIDTVGTTTDVHVLDGGVALFNGNINGFGNTATYSTTLALGAGEIVDFVVGFGTNGNFRNDSTALDATLTPNIVTAPSTVPEPSTLVVSLILFGMFGGVGLRKQLRTTTIE